MISERVGVSYLLSLPLVLFSNCDNKIWFLHLFILCSFFYSFHYSPPKCTSHCFFLFSCHMTSFPSCPSLDYLTSSSHCTFPILHLITPLKHAHLITQSLHISHYMIPFLYLIVISFLHLITFKPSSHCILHILKIYILSLPSFVHLIMLFLLMWPAHYTLPFTHLISALKDAHLTRHFLRHNSLNHLTYLPHCRFLTYTPIT